MRDLLGGFEAWVDYGDGDHPDAVLDALREESYLGEETLVGGAGHYLVGVAF